MQKRGKSCFPDFLRSAKAPYVLRFYGPAMIRSSWWLIAVGLVAAANVTLDDTRSWMAGQQSAKQDYHRRARFSPVQTNHTNPNRRRMLMEGASAQMRDFFGRALQVSTATVRLSWPRARANWTAADTMALNGTVLTTACCGLGHRTSRLLKVFVYASSRHMRVVVDWGACVGTSVKNIFTELFEDSATMVANGELAKFYSPHCGGECASKVEWVKKGGQTFRNEPPYDWYPLGSPHPEVRGRKEWGLDAFAPDVAPFSVRFAADLVASLKLRWRRAIERFIDREFVGGPVVGVHFRFGNGEQFARRPFNKTDVVLRAARALGILQSITDSSLRVFVASDDPEAINLLQRRTDLDIISRQQWRPRPGAGVLFSSWRVKDRQVDDFKAQQDAHNQMIANSDMCVERSADMLIDALLLGYTDILLLTVPSTFTVLPQVMAYARGKPTCIFLQADFSRRRHQPFVHLPLSCSKRIVSAQQPVESRRISRLDLGWAREASLRTRGPLRHQLHHLALDVPPPLPYLNTGRQS